MRNAKLRAKHLSRDRDRDGDRDRDRDGDKDGDRDGGKDGDEDGDEDGDGGTERRTERQPRTFPGRSIDQQRFEVKSCLEFQAKHITAMAVASVRKVTPKVALVHVGLPSGISSLVWVHFFRSGPGSPLQQRSKWRRHGYTHTDKMQSALVPLDAQNHCFLRVTPLTGMLHRYSQTNRCNFWHPHLMLETDTAYRLELIVSAPSAHLPFFSCGINFHPNAIARSCLKTTEHSAPWASTDCPQPPRPRVRRLRLPSANEFEAFIRRTRLGSAMSVDGTD